MHEILIFTGYLFCQRFPTTTASTKVLAVVVFAIKVEPPVKLLQISKWTENLFQYLAKSVVRRKA